MRRFFLGLALIAMLGVVPSKVRGNDRQIAHQIVTTLQEHKDQGDLTDFNIELEVEGGSVYLKGHVASEAQEKLAIEIARRSTGVRQVFNEMEIVPASKDDGVQLASAQGPARGYANADMNSRELAERIYARLRQEKDRGRLKGFSLDLEVLDGVATLTGKVATQGQLDLVLDVVRRVPGVKQVVNGLIVISTQVATGDISSEVIAEIQALKDNAEIKDFGVDVQVNEGIVWLSGYVASESQRQLILETASFVPGVTKVVNDLEISSPARTIPVSERRTTRRAPTPPSDEEAFNAPRPYASHDGPIGSAVAASVSIPQPSVPAPRLTQRSAPSRPAPAQYSYAGGQQTPLAFAPARAANHQSIVGGEISPHGDPVPISAAMAGGGFGAAKFDHPQMPNYAWPSYAAYPNYGAVTYPKQYSPMAWPYIGPFYPYPQVPLGWRKATLEWKDGWWQLDFKSRH